MICQEILNANEYIMKPKHLYWNQQTDKSEIEERNLKKHDHKIHKGKETHKSNSGIKAKKSVKDNELNDDIRIIFLGQKYKLQKCCIIKLTVWFLQLIFGCNRNWALQKYFPLAPVILEKSKETADARVKCDLRSDSKCQWICRSTIASLLIPTNW